MSSARRTLGGGDPRGLRRVGVARAGAVFAVAATIGATFPRTRGAREAAHRPQPELESAERG